MRLTQFRMRLPVAIPRVWRGASGRRAQPSRRSAAAAAIAGLIAFLAAQLGLGWAVHTERSPLRDPIFFDKLAKLREHRAFFAGSNADRAATVLFIGSSRTLNAVDARAAGVQLTQSLGRPVEAFNFGQAGAGPITNAVYLRRLIKEGVKPDFAVIEVHPTFLAGQRPDPPETRWLLPIRLRPDELPVVRAMGFPAMEPAVHGPRGFLAPWYEYRFLIVDRYAPFFLMKNQRLNGGHQSDAFGFARLQEHSEPESKHRLLQIAWEQYAYYFQGYRPNGCGVGGIRDTLDVCLAEGIRPALVLMPESPTWLGWYDADGLRELDRVMARLGGEYQVPVIDARTWVPDALSMDGHHLCGAGADVLTSRLVQDALVPWIVRKP
jgi:hypothetical protein